MKPPRLRFLAVLLASLVLAACARAPIESASTGARDAIAAHAQQIADATDQHFTMPETARDLKPNLALPADIQALALAELTAEALRLIAGVLAAPDEG